MSFRPRSDANPTIVIQRVQNSHLANHNSLLPNTAKDGTGDYFSPVVSTAGHLIVDTNGGDINIVHGTSTFQLVSNTSYNAGTHISNTSDCSNSTGLMSLHGTISGADVHQTITIQGSATVNGTYYDLNNIHVNIVDNSGSLSFATDFQTAFSFIRIKYINGDAVAHSLDSVLIFKT